MSVTILVAALIAAAASLLVAIVDRKFVARDERRRWERTDKRRVYAEFLGAATEYFAGNLLRTVDTATVYRRLETLVRRRAEVDLVGSTGVRSAAGALFTGLMSEDVDDRLTRELEKNFIAAARHDLDY